MDSVKHIHSRQVVFARILGKIVRNVTSSEEFVKDISVVLWHKQYPPVKEIDEDNFGNKRGTCNVSRWETLKLGRNEGLVLHSGRYCVDPCHAFPTHFQYAPRIIASSAETVRKYNLSGTLLKECVAKLM